MSILTNPSLDIFLGDLWKAIDRAGNQKEFARQHGLSEAYLSDVLNYRRDPGEKILKTIGYTRRIVYERTVEP